MIFFVFSKKNVYRNEKVKSVDFASCEIRSVRKPNISIFILSYLCTSMTRNQIDNKK